LRPRRLVQPDTRPSELTTAWSRKSCWCQSACKFFRLGTLFSFLLSWLSAASQFEFCFSWLVRPITRVLAQVLCRGTGREPARTCLRSTASRSLVLTALSSVAVYQIPRWSELYMLEVADQLEALSLVDLPTVEAISVLYCTFVMQVLRGMCSIGY